MKMVRHRRILKRSHENKFLVVFQIELKECACTCKMWFVAVESLCFSVLPQLIIIQLNRVHEASKIYLLWRSPKNKLPMAKTIKSTSLLRWKNLSFEYIWISKRGNESSWKMDCITRSPLSEAGKRIRKWCSILSILHRWRFKCDLNANQIDALITSARKPLQFYHWVDEIA